MYFDGEGLLSKQQFRIHYDFYSRYKLYGRRLPVFLTFLSEHAVEWRYKGTNLFLAGQIKPKVNTTSKTLAVSAVLLALALVFLMMGMSMGAAYKSNIAYEAPFDITVAIDADVNSFDDVIHFIETKADINKHLEYKIYEYQDDRWGNAPIMRLSDYIKGLVPYYTQEVLYNRRKLQLSNRPNPAPQPVSPKRKAANSYHS